MARCGAGSCSSLISAASASTRKAATKISSLNRRACTTKSGATALAAAAAKAGRSGEHEPRQVEGGEHHDAAGQSAKHADQMGQGWLIGRLHHECCALRQIDHQQGMVVGVASLGDADKLDDLVPRHAERVVDQAERHHHRDRREQKGNDGRPRHGRTRDGRPRHAGPHVYPPLPSAAPARTGF